jgi:Zn-dependent M28 family amino/carboxypeptidase
MSTVGENLLGHLRVLSEEIGERSIYRYANLCRARDYIISRFELFDYHVERQAFVFMGEEVENIIASEAPVPGAHHILCAHYDSIYGSPGADDNASGVAVMLEVARLARQEGLALPLKFIGFTTEEPPAFYTLSRGSHVYAEEALRRGEEIRGVICLEMVGYYSQEEGSQNYPFPLNLMGYPRTGNFIGAVGNLRSRRLTRRVVAALRKNPRLPVQYAIVPGTGYFMPDTRLSDHSSFWDRGYPALMLTDTSLYRNPYYHGPRDRLATLDLASMAELVESLLIFFRDEAALYC